jgi:hypothetical protein
MFFGIAFDAGNPNPILPESRLKFAPNHSGDGD